MIRRVRRQFICITMAMLTAVLLVPLIALNVVTEAMSYNQTRNLLEQIAISETTVPELPVICRRTENSPGSPRILPRRPALPLRKRLQRLPRKPQPRETAAAETTAKAAPAEQPKNPGADPGAGGAVSGTDYRSATNHCRTADTGNHCGKNHQPTGDKACGDHCAAADKTTPADDAAGSRSAALVGTGRTGSPLGKRRELCCRKAGGVLCRTAGAADPVYAHAPGRPRRTAVSG